MQRTGTHGKQTQRAPPTHAGCLKFKFACIRLERGGRSLQQQQQQLGARNKNKKWFVCCARGTASCSYPSCVGPGMHGRRAEVEVGSEVDERLRTPLVVAADVHPAADWLRDGQTTARRRWSRVGRCGHGRAGITPTSSAASIQAPLHRGKLACGSSS